MKALRLYNVSPHIPEPLAFLEELSHNMWWCWNSGAIELFRRISPHLWREKGRNPIAFLSAVSQQRLEAISHDDGFMAHLKNVEQQYREAVHSYIDDSPEMKCNRCTAYFSLEFGIHESIRTYSGGLGVLAGDHLKSASDLNIPLVGVSLLYRQGFFSQFLNNDGWQQESYPENELHMMPMIKARDNDNRQVTIKIPMPEGNLYATVWRLNVGRIPLYMLDANIPENTPEFRKITAQLYDNDRKTRLRQELLLGIGGVRALRALGYSPSVYHMNEGHAAFLGLQRLADLSAEYNIGHEEALKIVNRSSVFTTHTPVPAGNETFKIELLKPHLEALEPELKITPSEVIALGKAEQGAQDEISMTLLGLHFARYSNGVSKLHGQVARRMWSHLWPDYPDSEIPIGHITNGVHIPSWISSDNGILFDRYIGPTWRDHSDVEDQLSDVSKIPDEELWRAHELSRSRLIRTAREHLEKSLRSRNATRSALAQAKGVLDHDALTIGFARRFATYKRATLLLRNPTRLLELLTNDERPVQLVFAGKAHPADDRGKDLIRQIVHFAQEHNLQRRIVFLENYNINIARALVQGCDLWLNTPRRPHEASGTSGMKAAVNGCLNASILDGWWAEGYSSKTGWSIGNGEEYEDQEYQDTVESEALFNILENEIIPLFYDREGGELPINWIHMMKASVRMALGTFTSHRMVAEYQRMFYKPAKANLEALLANSGARAKEIVKQKKRLYSLWNTIKISLPQADRDVTALHVGDKFTVTTQVFLGELRPEEVCIQVYSGRVNSQNEIIYASIDTMSEAEQTAEGAFVFKHEITCSQSGRYGFTARAVPEGDDFHGSIPGLITWANGI